MKAKDLVSAQYDVDDLDDAIEFYYKKGWTDGLPVVPPTEAKVWRFLEASGREPDEILGQYETRRRTVTVEKIAINAVMAGCLPEYFPVILAIFEAILDPEFDLHLTNSTTGGAALGFIVNGPIRNELHMNYRGNVLGPGNRANSTIGRAVRLSQINVLGSIPGAGTEDSFGRPVFDRATLGQPGKYAGYHIVENEEDYPTLNPLHVELGFSAAQSTVTVFATGGHVQISLHAENSAEEIAGSVAQYLIGSGRLVATGGFCILVMPPENLGYLIRDGWSKEDFRHAIFEKTKTSRRLLKSQGWQRMNEDDQVLAITGNPDDIHIIAAGGPAGGFAHYLLPYGGSIKTREVIH